jgi:uncharacterized phage infection (PIP) family protein YhgE
MAGSTPASDAPSPDAQVVAIAGFGPAPSSALGAPSYALRVLKRQKELKAEITEINQRLATAEAERDGAEATLGQAALDYALVSDVGNIQAQVAEAEKAISAAKSRSAKEDEYFQHDLDRIDAEIARICEELDPLLARLQTVKDDLSTAQTHHRRVTAAVQRVQIEQRNIEQGKVQGDPHQLQDRHQQLRQELDRLRIQASESQRTLQQTTRAVERLDAESSARRAQLDSLEAQRQDVVDEYEDTVEHHSEEATQAMSWRRSQLATIGRTVYDDPPRPKLVDGERIFGRIEQSRAKVETIQAELDLRLKALDAYDAARFHQARYFAIGAGALLLLVVILLLY